MGAPPLNSSTLISAPQFTMFIAHEFFDALPVHVFQVSPFSPSKRSHLTCKRNEDGFREVRVDRNKS